MSEQIKVEPKKVVPLNPERSAATEPPVVLARMPAALHSLRDKARQQLQVLMRELFDKVDDALFERADKAGNNRDQNLYFDSMREVRVRRRVVEAAFYRNIDIKFAQLFDPNAFASKTDQSDKPVSLDELSLVKNDELEEMVAIEAVVNKANEQFAEPLQHLTMRIDHLVPVKVYQKNNPVGPDVICGAFIEAAKAFYIDVKAKLVLYKLFDNLLLEKLGAYIESLNQVLIDANILVSLKREPQVRRNPGATVPQAGMGSQVVQSYDEQTQQVLASLRNLLGAKSQSRSELPSGQEIASGELLKILSLAQHQARNLSAEAPHSVNVRNLLTDLLRSDDQKAVAINPVDDDVINLVGMMFEFILEDRNLAAPMKLLIGRLQIPMVKVAIADKNFFSKGGHPARRLLNEMAMACLGWQEPAAGQPRKDGLYEKMLEIVTSIIEDFDTDLGIFDRLLFDFRSYLEKEKRRAQILVQRTIDAEDGKAKSERARALVNLELERICSGREVPAAANKLLREAWANVMFITCLKQGVESQAWQDAANTARQLVWSVTAAMDKDNRQRLLKLVPELLQKLRVGLESISFSPFETTQLFKQLEALHLVRLRGDAAKPAANSQPAPQAVPVPVAVTSVAAPTVPAPADQPKQPVAPVAESAAPAAKAAVEAAIPAVAAPKAAARQNTFVVVAGDEADQSPAEALEVASVVAESPQVDPQHLALVGNITQGTWFEMQGEGGEKYRCRLAAIIRSVGKYIFVNRSGMKVAEESRESLAIALQTKRLTILDDGMLFDRALESVISNLRDKRTTS